MFRTKAQHPRWWNFFMARRWTREPILFRPQLQRLEGRDVPVLLTNGIDESIPGAWAFDAQNAGDSRYAPGSYQTAIGFRPSDNYVYELSNYVDVGSDGQGLRLAFNNITTPATLQPDGTVVSEGFFIGQNGQVNWRAQTTLASGSTRIITTYTFTAVTGTLGDFRFITYLDEDVNGASGGLLRVVGTPGTNDFLAYTLDQDFKVGFAQTGVLQPGPGLVNATFTGWTADQFAELRSNIEFGAPTYTIEGNIDTSSLPPNNNFPDLGPVFGPRDVTTAFAWNVDPNATTATITSSLQMDPVVPGTAPPEVSLALAGSPFSEDGGTVAVTIQLSTVSLDGPVQVDLAFGGTAVLGTDYTASATSVTIPPGNPVATVLLTGLPDALLEGEETIEISIASVTGATVGQPSTVFAAIRDVAVDLAVTKTDNLAAVALGQIVTYTIVVSNASTGVDVVGARVTDPLPADLQDVNWTAVFAGGATGRPAGSGAIDEFVDLPIGSTITYTLTGRVSQSALVPGTLSNTTTVTAPTGVTEINPADNTSTDIDTLLRRSDLVITKTDDEVELTPGGAVSYTVVVSNLGPSHVTGATVTDTFADVLSGLEITSLVATAGSSSSLAVGPLGGQTLTDTVNILAGGSITYVVTGLLSPSATGSLNNTATVAIPAGWTDPSPTNNTATDTSSLLPTADLAITTPTLEVIPSGSPFTYIITVTNNGPSDEPAALVNHPIDANFQNATWTAAFAGGATGTPSGSGPINEVANLPAGSSITYTITADVVSVGTPVTLQGTVNPLSVFDPVFVNNTLVEDGSVGPQVDLEVRKTLTSPLVAGRIATYVVTVVNNGPSPANGALVSDDLPAELTDVTWTATVANGATVVNVTGVGDIIDESVTLPVGGSITYTIQGLLPSSFVGALINTASVDPPAGTTELNPGDNSASVFDGSVSQVDLTATVDDGLAVAIPGLPQTYTIVVTNTGPSDAVGASVFSMLSLPLPDAAWTATFTGGATGTASGTGDINETVNLPAGSTITYTLTGTVPPDATGSLLNSVQVNASGAVELDPLNNAQTDADALTPRIDYTVEVTHNQAIATPGEPISYTVVVTNDGPSSAPGTLITDDFGGDLLDATWTATFTGGATGTASGSGPISEAVDMPVGSTITYVVTGTVNPATRGSFENTVVVVPPPVLIRPIDTATDSTPLAPEVDLTITKTDNQTEAIPGSQVTYTIVITNSGPSTAIDAVVSDLIPPTLTNVSWTAVTSRGAKSVPLGAGNLDTTVVVPPGETVTILLTGTVAAFATGELTNTVTVNPAVGETELNPADNTATDTDTLAPLPPRLVVGAGLGGGPHVRVFDTLTGQVVQDFFAYDSSLRDGVRVALGDVTDDGVPDIVTGAGPGGGPHVKTFDGVTGAEVRSFFAYDPSFIGGVYVAAADFNGDGVADIVTGAGAGGGPHVKVFDGVTGSVLADFYAYDPGFRGGVTVAAVDLNRDGIADIVTGAGPGGGPHVKVIDGARLSELGADGQIASTALLASFFAFDPNFRGGVFVGAGGDLNGDGIADIVTGAGPGGGPHVKAIDGNLINQVSSDGQIADTALIANFFAYDTTFTGGVRVAIAGNEIVTGAGPGGGPHVARYQSPTLNQDLSIFAYDPGFPGGVFVG